MCVRRLEIPTCGFDFGLSPPAQDDTRGESGAPRFVRSTVGDPDLRSPSGFDSGLRPPLRMTRRGGVMLFHCGGNHYAMVAPAVFIDI